MFGNSLAATSGVLTNSTPVPVDLAANTATLTVYVRPAAGDTVTVEYTLDGTNWTAWDNGSVTAYSVDEPWRLTVLPARQLSIEPPVKESW